jgi:microcystin-dependent protein
LVPADANKDVYAAPSSPAPMSSSAIGSSGAGQAHDNMQPYLGINFIIALVGIFPSRN